MNTPRPVRALSTVLALGAAALVLGACGHAEAPPAAPPVPVVSADDVAPGVAPIAPVAQVPNGREERRRANAGECFSVAFGDTSTAWTDWAQRRIRTAGNDYAAAQLDAEFRVWLEALPAGCSAADQAAVRTALSSIVARAALDEAE